MSRKILTSVSLTFRLQTGLDSKDSPIYQKKSFSNIYPKATQED